MQLMDNKTTLSQGSYESWITIFVLKGWCLKICFCGFWEPQMSPSLWCEYKDKVNTCLICTWALRAGGEAGSVRSFFL